MPKSKRDLIPDARALFVSGLSVEQVADSVGVSASTIHRWKSADEKGGHPWESRRADHEQRDPRALLVILETRFFELANTTLLDPDGLYKLRKVIDSVRDQYGDPEAIVRMFRDYAAWCMTDMDDEELAQERRKAERYVDHLRREERT